MEMRLLWLMAVTPAEEVLDAGSAKALCLTIFLTAQERKLRVRSETARPLPAPDSS